LRIVNDLRLIRLAIALGRHGNFARAAEEMSISQPSLTRGIAALERSLGVPLFDRTRKGAIPTVFGRVLLERGESMLRDDADLHREMQLLAGLEEGSLAIGSGAFAGEISVAETIARVVRAHPRLRIRFTVADPDQVVQDVLAGRIDVGVASTVDLESDARFMVETLPPMRVYLACRPGHPLARETCPSLARALEFPLATTQLRGAQAALAASAGATPVRQGQAAAFHPQILVNSLSHARLIARNSDALFPATAALLAEDVAAGRLVRLDCRVPEMRTTYGILYLRGRTLAPAAKIFIETLRAVEAEAKRSDVEPAPARKASGRRRHRSGTGG
jgi:DNA-binding transcriptional LysR family regulator